MESLQTDAAALIEITRNDVCTLITRRRVERVRIVFPPVIPFVLIKLSSNFWVRNGTKNNTIFGIIIRRAPFRRAFVTIRFFFRCFADNENFWTSRHIAARLFYIGTYVSVTAFQLVDSPTVPIMAPDEKFARRSFHGFPNESRIFFVHLSARVVL